MPDTTAYRLVFDAVRDFRPGIAGHQALEALILAAIVVLVFALFGSYRKQQIPLWVIGGAALVPVVAITFGIALSYVQMTQLRDAITKGRFATAEGVVTEFQAGDGHKPESFDVVGHHYEYSSSSRSAAFNQDAAVGGPIRDSLRVRITDVNGEIARLEIAK